jgi:peptidoglycan L-alanyl-D-glutamate endopeptidase CwlK
MKELEGLHPTLARKAERLVELCDSAGLRIKITQGYRSIEEQDRLYAQCSKGYLSDGTCFCNQW